MKRMPEPSGADSACVELIVQLIAARNEDIRPLGNLASFDAEREDRNTSYCPKSFGVSAINAFHPFESPRQIAELTQADGGLQVSEFEIITDAVVGVVSSSAPHRPPLVLQLPKPHVQPVIIGCNQ